MERRTWDFAWCVMAAGLMSLAQPAHAQQGRRPNVLVIMADDLNNDMGTYGHPMVKTPNIDRLAVARRAIRSRVHPVSAVQPEPRVAADGPAARHDARPRSRRPISAPSCPTCVTLPQLFKRNGYLTARVGKIYHYGNPGQIGTSGLDDPASWDVFVNPRGVDKDEETVLTNLTPARGLGSSLSYYASPAPTKRTRTARSRRKRSRCSRRTRTGRSSSARGSIGRIARSSRRRNISISILATRFALPATAGRSVDRSAGAMVHDAGALGCRAKKGSARRHAPTTRPSRFSTPTSGACSTRSIG